MRWERRHKSVLSFTIRTLKFDQLYPLFCIASGATYLKSFQSHVHHLQLVLTPPSRCLIGYFKSSATIDNLYFLDIFSRLGVFVSVSNSLSSSSIPLLSTSQRFSNSHAESDHFISTTLKWFATTPPHSSSNL